MTTTAGRVAAARPFCAGLSPLLALILATQALAVPVSAQTPKGRKVSVKDMEGFGKDITEIDLEQMIEEQQSKVGVASARPTTAEQAPGAVTVWKAEDIKNLGARTLLDLLRFVPGFDVTYDNVGRARLSVRGVGGTTTRGGGEAVLVLYDGVRLNDDVTGGAFGVNLDIPLDHIRQVEILRGAGAAVHGDAALAAVVSLVSQTTEDFMGTEAGAGFGSWHTQAYRLRSGGILGGLKISGFIRFADSDGARRLVPEDAQTAADAGRAAQGLPPISAAPGPARDGLRDLEAAYAFAVRDWTFSFRTKSDRSDGFIGVADNLGRQTQLNSSQLGVDVRWQRMLEGVGTVRAHAGFLRSELGDLLEVYPSGYQVEGDFGTLIFGEPGGNGGVFEQNVFNSRRYRLGASLEREAVRGHKLTGGLDLRRDATYGLQANANLDLRTLTPVKFVEGQSLGPLPGAVEDHRRTTFGLFVEDQWEATKNLNLTAGLRVDHLSDLGSTLSSRLSLSGRLGPDLGYKVLYGRAFRAPTFRELAFDLPGGTGNPDLSLVKADELALAISWQRNRLRLEAHPYLNLVKDTVVLPGLPAPGSPLTFTNAAGVRALGIEVVASRGFGLSNSWFANLTLQDPQDRETGRRVPGLPTTLLNAGVSVEVRGRAVVTPSVVARSSRSRAPGDPRADVPGYVLFGISARSKSLWRTLEAALSLDNLFARSYSDPSVRNGVPGDYPRPGRRVLLHASFKF